MAPKLGSSCCTPLLMLLLAVLLLASIQAGPVMASFELPDAAENAEKAVDFVNKMFTTALDKHKDTKGLSKVWKTVYKTNKYSCKVQRWMDKLGASGTPSFVDLSPSLRTFSYYVKGNGVVLSFCWFPQLPAAAGTGARPSTPLFPSNNRYPNDGRYYVQMTGIRVGVGREQVIVDPELNNLTPYLRLSNSQQYTYLERSMYGLLTSVVKVQMSKLYPWATLTSSKLSADQLCYAGSSLQLPRIAILLASNNAAMGTTVELGGPAWDIQPAMSCLGILPAIDEPVLGSMIQSGRTMTIDLTAAGGGVGGVGTLTF